jgi:hypothetical protein
MVGTTSHWEDELGRWLEPFLERLGHGHDSECVHFTWRG